VQVGHGVAQGAGHSDGIIAAPLIWQMGAHTSPTYPHIALLPGVAITLTVLACNLLGDGVRDALDPRTRT
jgi:hypothetical protein